MKKWKEFLLWFLAFWALDAIFDFIKSMIDKGILEKWCLVLVAFLTLLFGWIGVLFVVKSLKNKRTKNTEPQKSFSFWFIYFVLIWSVFMTFDVMKYCLENGMLNHWYYFVFGVVFMFIGWAAGRLGNILPKSNKHR